MDLRKRTSGLSWKQYGLGVAAFLFVSEVLADRPASERQYTITSPNGMYEFTMYPTVHSSISTTPPYGEAFRAHLDGDPPDEAAALWRVDGWYSFETFIADDGRGLVRIGPWAIKPANEELAIAFYREGREIKRYSVADLLEDTESVERTVSHYTWQGRNDGFPRLLPGNHLQVRTVESRIVSFDVATGEILSENPEQKSSLVGPQVTREAADDQFFAENLFRENKIDVDSTTISRVLRDDLETVIWVNSRFAGLPIFHHDVGYSFAANRRVNKRSDTGEPALLGQPLPPPSSFPIDHRPDIDQDNAVQTWLSGARANEFLGDNFHPRSDPEVTLGFHNLHLGTGREPEYRLAWRVRPKGDAYPVAVVDAKKGDVLYFDSGVRTARPSPSPAPAGPSAETLVGQWHAGPCGERDYGRDLTLYPDGTFGATDYVAPCPRDAECIWSGIVHHSGTWRVANSRIIEFSPRTSSSPQGEPIPGSMGFDFQTGRLHEATPGASVLCEYQRAVEIPVSPTAGDSGENSACYTAVQGRIAWDYQGHTRWQDANVRRLCAGAGQSTEPAHCFNLAMHGNAERSATSGWQWQYALELCAGARDAEDTIGCFERAVAQGSEWSGAIASCRLVR